MGKRFGAVETRMEEMMAQKEEDKVRKMSALAEQIGTPVTDDDEDTADEEKGRDE